MIAIIIFIAKQEINIGKQHTLICHKGFIVCPKRCWVILTLNNLLKLRKLNVQGE